MTKGGAVHHVIVETAEPLPGDAGRTRPFLARIREVAGVAKARLAGASPGGGVALHLEVEAADLGAAAFLAYQAVRRALALAGSESAGIARLEVAVGQPWKVSEALEETGRLVGTSGIARLLGVTSATILNWSRRPDFPAPFAVVDNRRVWRVEDVLRFGEGRPKRPGRAAPGRPQRLRSSPEAPSPPRDPDPVLDELTRLSRGLERHGGSREDYRLRNRLLREGREAGASVEALAAAVSLSASRVRFLIEASGPPGSDQG